jgi:hypothetical protein
MALSSLSLTEPFVGDPACFLVLRLALFALLFHHFVHVQCLTDFIHLILFKHGVCKSFVLLFIFRLLFLKNFHELLLFRFVHAHLWLLNLLIQILSRYFV